MRSRQGAGAACKFWPVIARSGVFCSDGIGASKRLSRASPPPKCNSPGTHPTAHTQGAMEARFLASEGVAPYFGFFGHQVRALSYHFLAGSLSSLLLPVSASPERLFITHYFYCKCLAKVDTSRDACREPPTFFSLLIQLHRAMFV